ncbi:MAG: DUF4153 domain-containing protein [Bacteroidetes bacterium]|nr:MAG: DUF4153 domain-containing protein [Bacteroidota bacterium]TAG87079.1 MAG: DUF4153 domain-containing protein [Bacteroidota bacterium]
MHITPFFILQRSLLRTFIRFPLPLICVLCAVGLGIYIADVQPAGQAHEALLQTFVIGFLLFFALKLYGERHSFDFKKKVYGDIFVVSILSFFYLSLPENLDISEYTYFLMWIIASFSLIWLAPHSKHEEWALSWQFHFQLWTRGGLAMLYAGIFYMGVLMALFTGETLWGVHISEQIMLEMGIFIFGFLGTWLLLTATPTIAIMSSPPEKINCPIHLKTFTQFVLLPLLLLYGSLLTIYVLVSVVYTPRQWDAWLYASLSYSLVALVTHLLIYPLIVSEKKWLFLMRIIYFSLLIISFCLIMGGIWRANMYGWTENRLLVFIVLCWLLVWSLYNIWKKEKVKLSYWALSWVFILLFFSTSFFNIFSFSAYSLQNHWGNIWKKYKALDEENQLVSMRLAGKKIPQKDLKQLSSIILYLGKRNKLQYLQPYFKTNLTQFLRQETDVVSQEELILQLIKSQQLYAATNLPAYQNEVNFSIGFMQNYESIQGYDHLLRFQYYDEKNKKMTYTINEKKYELNIVFWENKLILNDVESKKIIFSFELDAIIKNLFQSNIKNPHKVLPTSMRILAKSNHYQAILQIENINVVKKTTNEFHCHGIDGHIFLKF